MTTWAKMLIRAGAPERTLIVALYRIFSCIEFVKGHSGMLRWYVTIKIYRAIDWTGMHAAAEWFSRVSGLLAILKETYYSLDGCRDEVDRYRIRASGEK